MAANVIEIGIRARDDATRVLERVGVNVEGLNAKHLAMAAGAVAAVGAVVGAYGKLLDSTRQAGERLNDLSQRLGVSVERLAGLDYAAKRSGTSLEAISIAMRTMSVQADADAEAFARLGVQARGLDGALRDPYQLFLDVAAALRANTNAAERMALAQRVFGRSAIDLLPLLNQTNQELKKQFEEGTRLSGMTTQLAQDADKLGDAQIKWNTALGGLRNALTKDALAPLAELVETMADLVPLMERAAKIQVPVWFAGQVGGALGRRQFEPRIPPTAEPTGTSITMPEVLVTGARIAPPPPVEPLTLAQWNARFGPQFPREFPGGLGAPGFGAITPPPLYAGGALPPGFIGPQPAQPNEAGFIGPLEQPKRDMEAYSEVVQEVTGRASQLGESLVATALAGGKAGEALEQFAKQLLAEAAGSAFGKFIEGILPFQHGGVVPHTYYSTPGRDSVPAMLTPGEAVIPESMVREMRDLLHTRGAQRLQRGGVVDNDFTGPRGTGGSPPWWQTPEQIQQALGLPPRVFDAGLTFTRDGMIMLREVLGGGAHWSWPNAPPTRRGQRAPNFGGDQVSVNVSMPYSDVDRMSVVREIEAGLRIRDAQRHTVDWGNPVDRLDAP